MKKLFLKIAASLFLSGVIVALLLSGIKMIPEKTEDNDEKLETIHQDPVSTDDYIAYSFEELHEMNSDFVGKLNVGQILYECVVKSTDNFDYLEKNLEKAPYGEGTVFMDYRNELNDQNLIFYGHTVYSDETLRFGPLHQLEQQENYDLHHQIELDFGSEKRSYEIVCVMHFDVNETSVDYAKTAYTEEEMNQYIQYMNEHNLIDSNTQIQSQDALMTLQTDVKDNPDVKLVVVAKQVNR